MQKSALQQSALYYRAIEYILTVNFFNEGIGDLDAGGLGELVEDGLNFVVAKEEEADEIVNGADVSARSELGDGVPDIENFVVERGRRSDINDFDLRIEE